MTLKGGRGSMKPSHRYGQTHTDNNIELLRLKQFVPAVLIVGDRKRGDRAKSDARGKPHNVFLCK